MNKKRPPTAGRITPFIFSVLFSVATGAAAADISGNWAFEDDGTVVEFHHCPANPHELCATITKLPESSTNLPPKERKQLCGLPVLINMQYVQQKQYKGQIVDLDELATKQEPEIYPATLNLIDGAHARIDILGQFSIVVASYKLNKLNTPLGLCK